MIVYSGLYANRPTNPLVEDVYIATDTGQYLVCFVAGTWTDISGSGGGADKGCRAYHNVDQSIANATLVTMALNSENYDTDAMHDNVTNNSRITMKAGKHIVGACSEFTTNSTGVRGAHIRLNGSTFLSSMTLPALSGFSTILFAFTEWDFALNDYIELLVYQNSGITLNALRTVDRSVVLWARKVDKGG